MHPSTLVLAVSLSLGLIHQPTVPPPEPAAAKEEEVVVVQATGAGSTPREAFDDALRSALRQVVGAFLRADAKIESDVLVQDRILSHSQGFIESAEKVGPPELVEGTYRQEARVRVRRGRVADALGEAGKAESAVDGTSLYARIRVLREQKASAEQIYDAVFEGWPANVLACEVSQSPRVMDAPPSDIRVPEGHVCVEVRIDVMLDADRWAEWCKSAAEGLSAIATKVESVEWNPKVAGAAPHEISPSSALGLALSAKALKATPQLLVRMPDLDLMRPLWTSIQSREPVGHRGMTVMLLPRLGTRSSQCYFLPVSESVNRGDSPLHWGLTSPPSIECVILDGSGDTVGTLVDWPNKAEFRGSERVARELIDNLMIVASPTLASSSLTSTDDQKRKASRAVIALPTLGIVRHGSSGGHEGFRLISPRLTFTFRFIMQEAELDQPLTVRAELGPRPKQLR